LKVFVTGGTGILGRQIIATLFEKGYSVIALEKGLDPKRRKEVPFSQKIEWIDGDIGDLMAIQKGMEDASYVIHSAAMVSFDPNDRTKLYKINVEGTANIVNCALKAKNLKKLIHISSVASLSPSKPAPTEIDERNGFNPDKGTSDYAYSKYQAEMEIARGVEEGLKATMVNPSIILGQGDVSESSLSLFGYAAKGIPFYPSGWLNYVDTRDVCEIILRLMTSEHASGERIVLSGGHISYKDFLGLVSKEIGAKPPYIQIGPLLSEFSWRINQILTFFSGRRPVLTKFTARSSAKRLIFRSKSLPEIWPDFRFRKLEDSILWVCSKLK
jgi:nucleoside-diphosphate-sugar epimerase